MVNAHVMDRLCKRAANYKNQDHNIDPFVCVFMCVCLQLYVS